ncbi:VIR protein [Plasmodium vivax]|uniref:VIR protein n=1 Tax=Plasmodium vivax TaxID=5855 RepID=A0A1G4HDK5_PLAVI|nr:VIR protein [Plasmodium vivax]
MNLYKIKIQVRIITIKKIPDDIIKRCFDDYNFQIKGITKTYKCSYDLYKNMYIDQMKLNILDLFDNNINIIRQILIDPDDSNKTHCQKFVCECVKIYKNVYKSYCNDTIPENDKSKGTCGKLNTLKTIYNYYFFQNVDLKDKVPTLDGNEEEFGAMCKADEQLSATVVAAPELSRLSHSDKNRGEKLHQSFPSKEDDGENQSSRMSSTVSTALGTVAGASSILALLYKFSPARKLVHSGIQGNKGRMNSNFYEDGPRDLLFDGVQGEDMSSYNPTYNVGYGSV